MTQTVLEKETSVMLQNLGDKLNLRSMANDVSQFLGKLLSEICNTDVNHNVALSVDNCVIASARSRRCKSNIEFIFGSGGVFKFDINYNGFCLSERQIRKIVRSNIQEFETKMSSKFQIPVKLIEPTIYIVH